MLKIAIGMPVGEIVKPATAGSIAVIAWYIGKKGHDFLYLSEQSPYVDENANHIFERAQKWEADYLLMVESDLDCLENGDILGRMMAHNQDVVSGVYYRGKYPYRALIHNFTDKIGELLLPGGAVPDDEPYLIDACGSGFMLLSKKVLDAFTPEVVADIGRPFDFFNISNKLVWRQDIAFCWRLKQLGFKVLADPTIQLGHWKDQIVTKIHWTAARKHMEKTGIVTA